MTGLDKLGMEADRAFGSFVAGELFLLADVDGTSVAIDACRVTMVAPIGQYRPVPRAPAGVLGLVTLRSRVVTLIDCGFVATGKRTAFTPQHVMVMTEVDGFPYGLLVDSVRDVRSLPAPRPSPIGLAPGWQALIDAVIDHDNTLRMVMEPDRIIAAAATRRAA